jgi:hypothetical protein
MDWTSAVICDSLGRCWMLSSRTVGAKNNVAVASVLDLLERIAGAGLFRSRNQASSD